MVNFNIKKESKMTDRDALVRLYVQRQKEHADFQERVKNRKVINKS